MADCFNGLTGMIPEGSGIWERTGTSTAMSPPQSKLRLLNSQLSLHLLPPSQFLQYLLRVHVLELLEGHGTGISVRGCR